MVNANGFTGKTDDEIINKAIRERDKDGIVVIPPRQNKTEPERDFWLIDSAILLPSNTTVILKNCKIKLSDNCRDNFFRSANCGLNNNDPEKITNIHVIGEGCSVLIGADHPRSTGDAGKHLYAPCPHDEKDLLSFGGWITDEEKANGKVERRNFHNHSYGTDFDKEGENKSGDWRNIGVLFANVEYFSIKNITIKDSHCWGISLEACRHGSIEKINFDSRLYKFIDGVKSNIENQDGIDLRNGCSDLLISDITGQTGDDVIALTAIAAKTCVFGGGYSTHVMHSDWGKRERGIKNIIIKNVAAKSFWCWVVRLLPVESTIENVIIDNVIDTSEDEVGGGILIGEADASYGRVLPDSAKNIAISNVIVNKAQSVLVKGYLTNSTITNVINRYENGLIVRTVRDNALTNVKIN